MTLSQDRNLSRESRSPSPKRSRNEEEHPFQEYEAATSVKTDSPKTESTVENTAEETTVIPSPEKNTTEEATVIPAPEGEAILVSEADAMLSTNNTPPSEANVEEVTVEPEVSNNNEEPNTQGEISNDESEEQSNPTPEHDENIDESEDNKSFSFPSLIDPKDKKLVEDEKRQSPEVIQIDDENSGVSSRTSNGPQLPKLSTLETGKESEFVARRRPPFRRPVAKRRKREPNVVFAAANASTVSPQLIQSGSPIANQQQLILPQQQQSNLIRKPLTPIWNMIRNFPKEISNDYIPFYDAMCQWKWETIDEIKIPVIFRDSQVLVAHSVAHIKLFSKFPTNVSSLTPHLPADVTLESIPMTETEAWMMNFINTIVCNYELGMQIFQNGDNLVELHAIELYYFFAKKHYLEDLLRIYDGAVPQEALTECKNIIGAILNLKKKILDDLKKINEHIKIKYRPQNQSNPPYYPSPLLQNHQLY